MFERFSQEARLAVVGAQQVARAVGSRTIDTRHVLVALAEQDGPASRGLRSVGVDVEALAAGVRIELSSGGLDAEALASLGINLDAVRMRADEVFGPGALAGAGHSPGHIPFTSDAKKALQLALRETIRLGRKNIDGGSLLLGMLRADSPARDSLTRESVDLNALRHALEQPSSPGSKSA
jgi:ATP-dependent Clp protease ATP-binding subunit ClpA